MTTRFLNRPEGRIAYEVLGEQGPWVVCVPGLGDLRDEYRFLGPKLQSLGHRVVLMDVRGLGESDASFSHYSPEAVGGDIVALLRELGAERAHIVGTSMAAASAVWAAAEEPARIAGLVLVGPFVRDVPRGWKRMLINFVMRLAFARPWGARLWSRYYRSLYPTRAPLDFDDYQTRLRRNLQERGRLESLGAMMSASKDPCEARIGGVRAPALVVMGTRDPDFSSPAQEALLVAGRLGGETLMVDGAGHYPHAEMPEQILPRVAEFLRAHA